MRKPNARQGPTSSISANGMRSLMLGLKTPSLPLHQKQKYCGVIQSEPHNGIVRTSSHPLVTTFQSR
jgi:hypothetical protein